MLDTNPGISVASSPVGICCDWDPSSRSSTSRNQRERKWVCRLHTRDVDNYHGRSGRFEACKNGVIAESTVVKCLNTNCSFQVSANNAVTVVLKAKDTTKVQLIGFNTGILLR